MAVDIDGGVAVLAGPEVETPGSLRDLLDPLPGMEDVHVVLLLVGPSPLGEAQPADAPVESHAWLQTYALPVVAALTGAIAGPAMETALWADIRVCDAGASFQLRPDGSARQMALLGQRGCIELARRRGNLDATAARDLGLVSQVGEASADLGRAVASAIASRGPIATRLAKEAIWRGLPQPLEQALRFETDLTLLLQTTQDRAEGVRAFLEKRAPNFTGK